MKKIILCFLWGLGIVIAITSIFMVVFKEDLIMICGFVAGVVLCKFAIDRIKIIEYEEELKSKTPQKEKKR